MLPCPSSFHPPAMALSPQDLYSPHSQRLPQALPPGSLLSYSWVLPSVFLPGGASAKMLPSQEVESKCVSRVIPLPTPSKVATGLGDP